MENKTNNSAKRSALLALQAFVTDYNQGQDPANTYARLLEKSTSTKDKNATNQKILEKCRDLFKDVSLKKQVSQEISAIRSQMQSATGKSPSSSQIAASLLQCFSEHFWGDKRRYDMSQVASKNMLRTERKSDGTIAKVVAYASFEDIEKMRNKKNGKTQDVPKRKPPEITLQDKYGNPIHIQFMGCLAYRTSSSDEYIYKHQITKTIDGVEYKYEKFSNIDILALSHDKSLRNVVVSELLSDKNLTLSNADDYIGEISEQSSLEIGAEKFEQGGFYTYQISPKHALVYNGERIEAIRAYNQQEQEQAKAKTKELTDKDEEPEL